MGKMSKIFFDRLNSFIRVCIYRVSLGIDNGTELNDKLLKAKEIEIHSLTFIEQFNINISHKTLNLIFGGQEKEFVVFEELNNFHHVESFVSLFVVLEVEITLCAILAARVFEKNVPHNLVIFLEQVVNIFNVPGLHQLLRV